MNKKGAEILVDSLLEHGVEYLFGIPGGVVIPLFDVLYDSKVKVILCRHEQAAGHMADGYARSTGRTGVCLATSGPGATNLTTAIATAYMDSVPMVAITGQVKTALIGNDAFQEADVTGIMRPITKHCYLIKNVKDVARVVNEAFHIASTGRPGPVVIDLPVDVTTSVHEGPVKADIDLPGYKPSYDGHPRQIRMAAEAINNAQRPVIYAGGGVISSACSDLVREMAATAKIPVTTTLMGLGLYPEDDPLSLHMLGMHGTAYANYAVTHCDLLIAIGARFDDRITGKLDAFAPRAKIIHIDIDPTSISKTIKVDIPVVGDAKRILGELIPQLQVIERTEWLNQVKEWKEKYPLVYDRAADAVKPQNIVEQIAEHTNHDAIVVTDVGQHQMWAAQYYNYRWPRQFISSGGLGTMGFGFPAAIGAQFACPDRKVWLIAGDGSFQMNLQEFSTAVYHKLPVKIALFNNGFLGMVRQWQELFFKRRYSSTVLSTGNPDFVKVAQAYGARGIRIAKKSEIVPAIQEANGITDGPVLLDFVVEPEENVFPMVPAGEPIDKMIGTLA